MIRVMIGVHVTDRMGLDFNRPRLTSSDNLPNVRCRQLHHVLVSLDLLAFRHALPPR